MAGPASPGSEGPTFAPPPLPAGWIAQWDASSKKYYFVQLSTGQSQWETPTEAAPVGETPAARNEHPYGVPNANANADIIVHPDGSQTARYPDGRLEPVNPREDGSTTPGTRGVTGGGGGGDRSLGVCFFTLLGFSRSTTSWLMVVCSLLFIFWRCANLYRSQQGLLGSALGGNKAHGGGGGGIGGLAGSVLGGLGGKTSGGHGGGSGGIGGKLASQLASNLFSGGSKPGSQPQGYHGGQPAHHSGSSGGLGGLGGLVGGVAGSLLGGKHGSVS
jgi:hypothetical protein